MMTKQWCLLETKMMKLYFDVIEHIRRILKIIFLIVLYNKIPYGFYFSGDLGIQLLYFRSGWLSMTALKKVFMVQSILGCLFTPFKTDVFFPLYYIYYCYYNEPAYDVFSSTSMKFVRPSQFHLKYLKSIYVTF